MKIQNPDISNPKLECIKFKINYMNNNFKREPRISHLKDPATQRALIVKFPFLIKYDPGPHL